MESEIQPIQSFPQTPPVIPPKTPTNWPKNILFSVLGFIIVAGSVFVGIQLGKNQTPTQPPNVAQPTVSPVPTVSTQTQTPTPSISSIGSSVISFADSGDEIYLKHTVSLIETKVEFPNSKERTLTKVYTYDISFEPQELRDIDVSKYIWTDLVVEDVKDSTGSKSILISDRLFSFKKIPNTNSFIFAVEWNRSAGQNQGSWSPYQIERVLFYYDKGQGKLNKIQSFSDDPNNTKAYTYPKIDSFSQDNRYVSLQLFGCWGCGGHMPETLLLDTQTFKTKNIDKVVQFAWTQNGVYEYKDYVVIECKEPQPGECTQDPSTLPLKTGQF